jgi:hypothetical protein
MDSVVFPCVVLTAAIAIGLALHRRMAHGSPTQDTRESLGLFSGKPVLYWFCDSEINARSAYDFSARNSDDLNRGYLEVALDALRATQSAAFTIKPLRGRDAILAEIPNADPQAKQLPPALFRLWVIANLCAKRGGLAMDGNSTLCVGPSFSTVLKGVDAATFGVDPDEPLNSAVGPAASPYVGYASAAGHPGWWATAAILNSVVAAGPTSWSAAVARRIQSQLHEAQQSAGIVCIREADGGRLPNGQARQLEDLLGRVASPPDPNIALAPGVVYVPYDGDALIRRYEFAWFPRLSKQQIQESDLVWASYAGL